MCSLSAFGRRSSALRAQKKTLCYDGTRNRGDKQKETGREDMELKVNFPLLEDAGYELKAQAQRMQAVSDEMQAARFSLLHFGDTFWREASLTGRKVETLEREIEEMRALADVLLELSELYAGCERKLERGTAFAFWKWKVVLPPILQSEREPCWIRPEQLIERFEKLIGPLLEGQ